MLSLGPAVCTCAPLLLAINWAWVTATATEILMVGLSALVIYVALVLMTRLTGLRSFSKMSSFDFAITVALGTVLASTLLNENPPVARGLAGLAALYAIQYVVSLVRSRSDTASRVVDNEPLLLMTGTEVLYANLREARMTTGDLRGKLREANVMHPSQLRAVVMETTGDVSVLHTTDADGPELYFDYFTDVRDGERLQERSFVEASTEEYGSLERE